MLIFFFIVVIYSTANYYFFSRLTSTAHLGTPATIVLGVLILFMTLSPVLIPLYNHRGSEKKAKIFSYAGYLWLAFLVPFFPLSLLLDLYNSVAHYSVLFGEAPWGLPPISRETSFFIALVLSIASIAFGYLEAKNIRVERLVMPTARLPGGTDRVRIAQISDLHLGVIVRDSTVKKVIGLIEKEKPDIIVSTGDLVDGITRHIDHLAPAFRKLEAPLGKYAVVGNHEVYGGLKNTERFIRDSGFVLLRGEGMTAGNTINIAGMDFLGGEARQHRMASSQEREQAILSRLPPGLFTVLLKHRSDVEDESLGLFDLQLSGHTHKGQIFPMNLATMFLFSYHSGFTRLSKGSAIYTSRGTGTAGPPVRFLSRPEVTIIDIIPTTGNRRETLGREDTCGIQ